MALRLIQSNRLERLLAHWLVLSATSTQGLALFEPEWVMVQSKGMGRWLHFQRARAMGSATNIEYVLPASWLWQMMNRVLGALPEASPLAAEVLPWRVLHVLQRVPELTSCTALCRYFEEGDAVSQYALAEQLASVYDQYLVYRPDWITAWERDERIGLGDDEYWQAAVWKAVVESTQGAEHRAHWLERMLVQLEQPSAHVLPPRLILFGITSLPPRMMTLLQAVARHSEVVVYVLNPCEVYWGDIRDPFEIHRLSQHVHSVENRDDLHFDVGHPLLARWGKQGREFIQALTELLPDEHLELFPEFSEPSTLLECLQFDIQQLQVPSWDTVPYYCRNDDRSIGIHACFSIRREVEVLRDTLLKAFEDDPELQPDQVVVLTPDIETYTPHIDAVFGSCSGEVGLPYAIADRTVANMHPMVQAFLELLNLPDSRLSVPDVLFWLDQPAVLSRFGFDDNDRRWIERWIDALNVVEGRDGDHRAEFGALSVSMGTWREAIDRLLLGAMLPSELLSNDLIAETVPLCEVGGHEGRSRVVAFGLFLETLFEIATQLTGPHVLSEWSACLRMSWSALVNAEHEDVERVQVVVDEALTQLSGIQERSGYTALVERRVVARWLMHVVNGSGGASGFLTGGITFCTLVPMRSLPFKYVAVLGLNDGALPRPYRADSLDLMARYPRVGDRSRQADDRFVMLETILSARQWLHLSYVAKEAISHTLLPPSVLIADLLDALGLRAVPVSHGMAPEEPVSNRRWRLEGAKAVRKYLVQEHPLHPFDSKLFDGDGFGSYSVMWARAANASVQKERAEGQPLFTEGCECLSKSDASGRVVEWSDLISWANNSSRTLLRHRGVTLADIWAREWREEAPLVMPERRFIPRLRTQLAEGKPEQLWRKWRAEGFVPSGKSGEQWVKAAWQELVIPRTYWEWEAETPCYSTYRIDYQLANGVRVVGQLPALYPLGRKIELFSKSGQYRLWHCALEHLWLLILQPEGVVPITQVIRADSRIVWGTEGAKTIHCNEAESLLIRWVEAYLEGQAHPVPLFGQSSGAFGFSCLEQSAHKEADRDKAYAKALQVWSGTDSGFGTFWLEQDDPWHALLWRDQNPWSSASGIATQWAEHLIVPLYELAHLTKG